MAEIEIRTTGELLFAGDVVGQITWIRPYCERDVAGTFEVDTDCGCAATADEVEAMTEEISDLEDDFACLKESLEAEKAKVAKLEAALATQAGGQ